MIRFLAVALVVVLAAKAPVLLTGVLSAVGWVVTTALSTAAALLAGPAGPYILAVALLAVLVHRLRRTGVAIRRSA